MAVSFVYWYTDQQDKRNYQRYEIYFNGTVSGLTEGQPGALPRRRCRQGGAHHARSGSSASACRSSPTSTPTAPIDARTLALLSLQGVTGLLYIDLEQDPKANAAGPLRAG